MTNAEALHRLYALVQNKDENYWNAQFDLNIENNISVFFTGMAGPLIEKLEDKTEIESSEMTITALLEDLLELKWNGMVPPATVDICQFWYAAQLVDLFCSSKLNSRCFQWINNAVDNSIKMEGNREFDFGRLDAMIKMPDGLLSHIFWKQLYLFLTHLFELAHRTGWLYNHCKLIIKDLLSNILKTTLANPVEEYIQLVIQILGWCRQYNQSEQEIIGHALFEVFSSTKDRLIQKSIAFQFAVSGMAVGGKTGHEWIDQTLEVFPDLLQQHDKTQLLIAKHAHSVDDLLKHLDEIKETIKAYVADLNINGNVAYDYHVGHIYKIVEPAIICLVINGHIPEANQLIASYFKIPEKDIVLPDNLFIVPNYVTGLNYSFRGNMTIKDPDPEAFKNILKTRGEFYGTNLALLDDPDFPLTEPRVYGKPIRDVGPKLHQQLKTYFNFENLLYLPGISDANGFTVLFDLYLPIQNIITLALHKTLPILRNYCQPKQQRTIKKVFIWQGDTYTTQMEAQAIQQIFAIQGIEVIIKVDTQSSKEEFLEHFKSAEYDVFWILSHGEFEHSEPHTSKVNLGNDIYISIQELMDNNYHGEQRRLLIMDMCDGATAHMNNQVSMGLGSSVSHASQSIFGHSWLVEPMLSVELGLLLATYLAEGQSSYAEAHCNTIHTFVKGKQALKERLLQFIDDLELMERIDNSPVDYNNFYYWGILNYLE